jgi:SEC-C motif-containing protein
MKPSAFDVTPCPCGSGYPLEACCAPYIANLAPAPTALTLMRSRYTAYTMGMVEYLKATWHPRTRPASLVLEPERRWLGLKILDTAAGMAGDASGRVEFVARFKIGGRAHRLRERSRFELVEGRWLYVDGDVDPPSG